VISGRKHGALVRAFFAVDLSDAARGCCADLAGKLEAAPDGEGVRWVRPESLHVTVRFLGNVETESVPQLAEYVGDELQDQKPFRLRLGALAAFPSPRRPRVIALSLEPEEPLRELAERVERGVVATGLAPEKRAFRAHLTLGRLRNRRFPSLEAASGDEAEPFPVRDVVLYQSDLERTGPRYTPLERLSFGAAAAPELVSP